MILLFLVLFFLIAFMDLRVSTASLILVILIVDIHDLYEYCSNFHRGFVIYSRQEKYPAFLWPTSRDIVTFAGIIAILELQWRVNRVNDLLIVRVLRDLLYKFLPRGWEMVLDCLRWLGMSAIKQHFETERSTFCLAILSST